MEEPKKMVPLTDPEQIRHNMSKDEEIEFWETHQITREYVEKTRPTAENFLPRSRSITVRFDEDLLQRLKRLAEREGKGYQTLLKEYIGDRVELEEELAKITDVDKEGAMATSYPGLAALTALSGALPALPVIGAGLPPVLYGPLAQRLAAAASIGVPGVLGAMLPTVHADIEEVCAEGSVEEFAHTEGAHRLAKGHFPEGAF